MNYVEDIEEGVFTFVQSILILLAVGTAANHAVELVHDAAGRLLRGGLSILGALSDLSVFVAAGEVLDKVHYYGCSDVDMFSCRVKMIM